MRQIGIRLDSGYGAAQRLGCEWHDVPRRTVVKVAAEDRHDAGVVLAEPLLSSYFPREAPHFLIRVRMYQGVGTELLLHGFDIEEGIRTSRSLPAAHASFLICSTWT